MVGRALTVLLIASVLAAACGGDGGEPASSRSPSAASPSPTVAGPPTIPPLPTLPPRPTATPVATHPQDVRTEIEVIDRTLDALVENDADAVVDQLSFHPHGCNALPSDADGSNPCPPGTEEGDPVDVIAFGDCDISYLAESRAGLRTRVRSFVQDASEQGLYAVVEVAEGRLSSPLPLQYLIILSGGHTLLLDEAGITHLGVPCGSIRPAEVFHPADTPILAPPG